MIPKKWQDVYDIVAVRTEMMSTGTIVEKFHLRYKDGTPAGRDYGYSYMADAKRAAAQLFTISMKKIEKELLGDGK